MAKKALVVGINTYGSPNDLPSSTRDADAFAGVLESMYRFEQIRVLKDGEATRELFERALDGLLHGASPNDRLVLYFSGHGARYERGGVIEEGIVLQDGKFYDDQDLVARTEALPPGILTVVLDCSFSSGTEDLVLLGNGDLEGAKVKGWIPPDVERLRHHREATQRARSFSPFGYIRPATPEWIAAHFRSAAPGDSLAARVVPLVDPAARMLVVSACLEDEAAIASTSQTNGLSAFTSCLLASIRRLGPNRSTVEALQAAGHELRRLGFRQTPIVKEPVQPEHLGLRAFLTFQPALFVYSPTTPGAEQEEQISRSVAEAIRNSLGSLKEGQMQGTMSGQTFMGEPYSPWMGFGAGHHFGAGQFGGQFGAGLHPLGHQFGSPWAGQQWGLSPYSSFGLSQFGGGGYQQAQEIPAIVTSVVCSLLPLLQSRGYGAFFGQGGQGFPPYQQPWGAGPQPYEIAQIVSAVTPIVASIVQSRGQMMPRAA